MHTHIISHIPVAAAAASQVAARTYANMHTNKITYMHITYMHIYLHTYIMPHIPAAAAAASSSLVTARKRLLRGSAVEFGAKSIALAICCVCIYIVYVYILCMYT